MARPMRFTVPGAPRARFEVVTFRTKGHPPIYAVFATAAHDIPHPIDRLQHRLRRQVRVVSTT